MTAPEQLGQTGIAASGRTIGRNRVRLYQGALFVLALFYSIQILTPLRLHPDSIVLLSIADSAAHGKGFLDHGHATVFPPGYPAFAALLLRLRLAHSCMLVGFNIVSLIVGLWAVSYILMRRVFASVSPVLTICLVSSSSFVLIRNSALPLTDAGFFGLAMCCLAAMESISHLSPGREFWARTLASCAMLAPALAVRRVGIALIPALLWSLVSHAELRRRIKALSNRTKGAMLLGTGCAGALVAWIVASTSTLRDWQTVVTGAGFTNVVFLNLVFRFRELSEIAINLSFTALPATVRPVILLVGGLFLALVLRGVAIMVRRGIGPTTVFLCTYSLVVFVWPCYDPRFWLPAIPLLMGYAGLAVARMIARHRSLGILARFYVAMFILVGMVTLGWSTMVTFSGSRFPDAYHTFSKSQYACDYSPIYCAAYGWCPDGATPTKADDKAVHLLREFN